MHVDVTSATTERVLQRNEMIVFEHLHFEENEWRRCIKFKMRICVWFEVGHINGDMTDLVLKNEDTDAIVSNSILPITTVEMHIGVRFYFVLFVCCIDVYIAVLWNVVACPEVIDTEDMISFNPQFTYHLFNESENDETYEDVKIDVFYSALDLSAWLRIQSDSKVVIWYYCYQIW